MEARYIQAGGSQGLNPGRGKVSQTHPDQNQGPPTLLYNGYRVSFPKVMWPGHGIYQPPPSSTKVQNGYSLSTLSSCLACYKAAFTFTLTHSHLNNKYYTTCKYCPTAQNHNTAYWHSSFLIAVTVSCSDTMIEVLLLCFCQYMKLKFQKKISTRESILVFAKWPHHRNYAGL